MKASSQVCSNVLGQNWQLAAAKVYNIFGSTLSTYFFCPSSYSKIYTYIIKQIQLPKISEKYLVDTF